MNPRLIPAFTLWLALLGATSVFAADFIRVRPGPDLPLSRRPRRGQREVLHRRGVFVDMVASPALQRELKSKGYRFEVLQDDIDGSLLSLRRPDTGGYHRHKKLVDRMEGWERRNPDLVQVHEIGQGAEILPGGNRRSILAARFSSGERPRPRVLVFGGIHARELATAEVPLLIGERLLAGAKEDAQIRRILATREVWLVPCLNPDGREYCFEQDPWWRKNRAGQQGGAVGVDLNRNFGFRWGPNRPNGGSSGNPHSGIYRGPSPFSEPETQALRDLVTERQFSASLALHAYGEMVILPYGYSDRKVEHSGLFGRLGQSFGQVMGYKVGAVAKVLGYYSNGRHDDWLYASRDGGKKMTGALELELGRSFFPRYKKVREMATKVGDGVLAMAEMAGVQLQLDVQTASIRRNLTEVSVGVQNLGIADAEEVRLVIEGVEPKPRTLSRRFLKNLPGLGGEEVKSPLERRVRLEVAGPLRRVRVTAYVAGENSVRMERVVEPFVD